MTPVQKLELRQSERRQRLNELAGLDELSDETRAELDTLQTAFGDGERQLRAAIVAEAAETEAAETEAAAAGEPPDAETRARLELRSRCSIGNYMEARLNNRAVTGAEAELAAEVGTAGIPLELFEPTAEKRASLEQRAVSAAPSTVGVNLDLIRPFVFAPAVVPRLGVEMPRVPSGTYATGTITTALDAAALGKGTAATSTGATITVATATPKRISGRLELAIEDTAAVGQDNFEMILRDNLSLALSAELDDQGLNGAGADNDLNGLFQAITDPAGDAPSAVATFDDFVAEFAGGVDGLWATATAQVGVVVGVDTYQLAAKTFRDTGSGATLDGGTTAFTDYAMAHYGGFWTSDRMPAKVSDVQQAILYRRGRAAEGASAGMRTAVCPVWSELMIDDVYTGSAKGERYVTFHVLVGDVILVQPAAYKQVQFKVS